MNFYRTLNVKLGISLITGLGLALVGGLLINQVIYQGQSHEDVGTAEEIFGLEKVLAPANYDIVLVGDSRTEVGVSPAEMERWLPNLRVLNLGLSRGGVNAGAIEFARAKLHPKSIKPTLLLGITPHSLTASGYSNASLRYYRAKSQYELLELKLVHHLGQIFPRLTFEGLSQLIFNGRSLVKQQDRKVTFHQDGWQEVEMNLVNMKNTLEYYQKLFQKRRFYADGWYETLELIRRYRKMGIDIYAFRPPTPREMIKIEHKSRFKEKYIIESFQAAGGKWIQVGGSNYTSYDGSHLNSQSARKLSKTIALRIGKIQNYNATVSAESLFLKRRGR